MSNERELLPLARTDALVIKELQDEMLVYDLKRDKAHCLNQAAAAVWKHCDGKMAVADVARRLEKELKTPVDTEVVWLALKQLDKFHLLQERVTRPNALDRLSRRDLVRRIGVAAVLLPAIISISAPTARAQASCKQLGVACADRVECCSNCCIEEVFGAGTVCSNRC